MNSEKADDVRPRSHRAQSYGWRLADFDERAAEVIYGIIVLPPVPALRFAPRPR